jgi:putative ABC transport system permease protein
VHAVAAMPDVILSTMTLERAVSFLTTFFASAALLMATLGVYGVIAYAVRQRTMEIGMRMMLGASSRDVLHLVLGDGLKLAAYGIIAGGAAAAAGVYVLGRIFETVTLGPGPFIYSTAIVAVLALVASFVPALRAALLSPLVVLRGRL